MTVLQTAQQKVGAQFPGYLTFENNVVGAYYLPNWSGAKAGIAYHDILRWQRWSEEIFSQRDFILVAALPALSGLLFVLLGTALCLYLPSGSGKTPLLLFHFLVGNYVILSADFHLTHLFSYLHLTVFAMIPATMIHFAFLFPEKSPSTQHHGSLFTLPYLISVLFLAPYMYFFMKDPQIWIYVEYAVVAYVTAAYLFWLIRLAITLKKPHLEFNRIIARYLLLGQIIAFVIPLVGAITIFIGGLPFPLNLATPFILLFPISLFIGIILGRLRQSQMQLIQSEKMATLGNLLAGLAHELNNPMTFIYSNIEPLREALLYLKTVMPTESNGSSKTREIFNDLSDMVTDMEEGASRAKTIIDNFRHFSHPGKGKQESVDLRKALDQSINLLTPKWKNRIKIEKNYHSLTPFMASPGEMGQIFVNLIANACDAIQDTGTITVTSQDTPTQIKISIRDTGVGIAKRQLNKIFDPFYTTKPQGEGTGLGLAISQQIVKNHKGKIEVQSILGQGSEFVIILPKE